MALARLGNTAEAIEEYRRVLQRDPDCLPTLDNLALILSSHPDPQFRDAGEAVRIIKRACELTEYRDPAYLDTLAAACAEAGQFDQAVSVAAKALQLARAQQRQGLVSSLQRRLSLYQQGHALREP